jgi:hypothetical protein
MIRSTLALGLALTLAVPTHAAELVALSPQTWERFAPHGKEADAIYGDFAICNGSILGVIAHPKIGRNANMTVRDVGGSLIDLTVRTKQSDQLSAFYPGAHLRDLNFGGVEVEAPSIYEVAELDRLFVQARRVTLRLVASPKENEPDVEVAYTLQDGWTSLQVATTFANRRETPVEFELVDALRADGPFEMSPEERSDLFWAYDRHFGQAYGFSARGRQIVHVRGRQHLLRYADHEGKVTVRLQPGESFRLVRHVTPGANLFDLRLAASARAGQNTKADRVEVKDTAGRPVAEADVVIQHEGRPYAWGRTDRDGSITIEPGVGPGKLKVSAPGYGEKTIDLAGPGQGTLHAIELPEPGRVRASITDEQGKPIACKVQFVGRDGTRSPDFGPESGDHAVRNLIYSAQGRFTRILDPGSYDVIVSHGPEYDAIFAKLEVERGKVIPMKATLVRSVKTEGWISGDFHSHSSPSGDNTSSQLGRVLNLLCEHIEFAPCTEHNRLSTYAPHLKRLGAEGRMATCVGIELTGSPLPLNHQNAFPMVLRPHTQNGGGPSPDLDPAIQIERLALWDQSSEKLVQVNHPDLGWMFRDRNGDGHPDTGFKGMFGHIDVLEVHPPQSIFGGPKISYENRVSNNTILNWMQLLNQGRRIPGVVNTDAHYNFHGSGWLRNYIKSPTDDPAAIKTLDVVHAAEKGNLVMSTGPFMEVSLRSISGNSTSAGPGDAIALEGGKATLQVRVQCPNWFDVDRVQVFVNGRAAEGLNFTRRSHPDRFATAVMKFDQEIPLTLKSDAHVIVAAIGEKSKLGPVMGPDHAEDPPVAVSNPIYVDVDGGGFRPNEDPLGPLPVKNGLEP